MIICRSNCKCSEHGVKIEQADGRLQDAADLRNRKGWFVMDKAKFQSVHQWVKDELKRSVDFWLSYGMDREHGGVYTCIDRKGNIYSTDKSVWMQGRCGWIFAFLCTNYGKRPEWLEASRSCLDFLEEHCVNRDAGGRLYFTVTGDGQPLRQRRY